MSPIFVQCTDKTTLRWWPVSRRPNRVERGNGSNKRQRLSRGRVATVRGEHDLVCWLRITGVMLDIYEVLRLRTMEDAVNNEELWLTWHMETGGKPKTLT